jgi:hypothetical protein
MPTNTPANQHPDQPTNNSLLINYNTRSRMSHPIQILVGCSCATRIKYCRCPRNWVSRIGNSCHELWTLLTPALTRPTLLFTVVNMPRPRHSKKEIEDVLRIAEQRGFTVLHPWGHWGALRCPGDCRMTAIFSTPANSGNHARALQRFMDRCPHEAQPSAEATTGEITPC